MTDLSDPSMSLGDASEGEDLDITDRPTSLGDAPGGDDVDPSASCTCDGPAAHAEPHGDGPDASGTSTAVAASSEGSPYAGMSAEERADVVTQLSGAISALQAELGRAVAAVDAAADHVADGWSAPRGTPHL